MSYSFMPTLINEGVQNYLPSEFGEYKQVTEFVKERYLGDDEIPFERFLYSQVTQKDVMDTMKIKDPMIALAIGADMIDNANLEDIERMIKEENEKIANEKQYLVELKADEEGEDTNQPSDPIADMKKQLIVQVFEREKLEQTF